MGNRSFMSMREMPDPFDAPPSSAASAASDSKDAIEPRSPPVHLSEAQLQLISHSALDDAQRQQRRQGLERLSKEMLAVQKTMVEVNRLVAVR